MMRQYAMLETRRGKAAFGVFLFAMLMLARDTLMTSSLLGFNQSQFLMLGLMAAFGVAFLWENRKQWKQLLRDPRLPLLAGLAVIFVVPMIWKRDWQMMYFSMLLCLFFAVFLSFFTNVRETAKYYVLILSFLALHSLVSMYVLKPFALSGQITPPVFDNSNDWYFYNFGFSYVVTWDIWHRNFGIFREPGVYQFFLLLGMYLNNYRVDWKKLWRLWAVNFLLVATMLSTFAVGGLVETALFALFLYFDKKWYRSRLGKVLGIAAVAAVGAAVTFIVIQIRKPYFEQTFFYNFYDLYLRLFTRSDSLVDRLSAIWVNARLFFASPLVGDTIANVLHGTAHNTSSTLILFATLGILGGLLHLATWMALAWEKERSVIGNLFLLLILFMSFNTQNLVADVFFWLFPMMALTERGLPVLTRRIAQWKKNC